jgi:hypothetical protein
MDTDERKARADDLMERAARLRTAADLIKHGRYNPYNWSYEPDDGHSVASAIAYACNGDRAEADDLTCRVAGALLLRGEQVSTRPANGDVADVVRSWEGRLTHPTKDDAVGLLAATAAYLETRATLFMVTSQPSGPARF